MKDTNQGYTLMLPLLYSKIDRAEMNKPLHNHGLSPVDKIAYRACRTGARTDRAGNAKAMERCKRATASKLARRHGRTVL